MIINKISRMLAGKLPGPITHAAVNDPVVALTFDDGPHPSCTPRVLDILGKYSAAATFFMVGALAEKHPGLVRRIAHAGHAIGNHTHDHVDLTSIGGRERRRQISDARDAIFPYDQRIFRPPWGRLNPASKLDLFRYRYDIILWNIEVGDWLKKESREMSETLLARTAPGSIILLHDAISDDPETALPSKHETHTTDEIHTDRAPMLEALAAYLDRAVKTYRFITVPQLIAGGKPYRRKG